MQPINLNRFLIEHNIILWIKHIVVMLISLCQKICDYEEIYADFVIHGNYRLSSMYITNYPIYTPLLVAFLECKQYVRNEGIAEREIDLSKFDDCPMQRVKSETTINKLVIRHVYFIYAYTPDDLRRKQRESQGGSRQIARL